MQEVKRNSWSNYMTRKEFIKKFNLTRTKTKCCFFDGRIYKERMLYVNDNGTLYTIYDKDLFTIRPYKQYVDGMEKLDCSLGAAYSWYH